MWNCGFLPLNLLIFVELLQRCDIQIRVDAFSEILLNLGLKNGKLPAAGRGSTMLQSKRNVVY